MFVISKQNPFDPRLSSHKIQKLSARYGRVIYAPKIEADLRVVIPTLGHVADPISSIRIRALFHVSKLPANQLASK